MKWRYDKINNKRVGGFRMKKIVTLLLMLILIVVPVKAEECSYTAKADAMKKAANVKVDYEVVEDTEKYEDGSTSTDEYFKISILNVTE